MLAEELRSEDDLRLFADAHAGDAQHAGDFLSLLNERHVIYAGATSLAAARVRAAVIDAVAHRALPATALPFVLEELETAHDPDVAATAAHALRRFPEPHARFVRALESALDAIRHHDAPVMLRGKSTTVALEVLRSLRWLVEAGCYPRTALVERADVSLEEPVRAELLRGLVEGSAIAPSTRDEGEIARIVRPAPPAVTTSRLEDHEKRTMAFAEAFAGATTIVCFFFTRCGNPLKCPLTITRLGRLQRRIDEHALAVRTAAFTYDPAYDTPSRMLHYARGWGATPSDRHRFLRVIDGFEAVQSFFDLGVGYGPGGVNRHRLEVFVVNREVAIVRAIQRQLWSEETMLKLASEVV